MARTMIRIGGYLIDAIITEESGLDAEVTEYPVESGAVITDHVRNLPGTLELEFVVSDTPIGEAASARPADVVPSTEARQKLEALRATRQPFAVITPRRTYASMVFTSLRFPLDGTTGDALRATATLKEIQIVDVRRVSVQLKPNFGRRAARNVSGGKLWLCPGATVTSTDDAENQRNGCREVKREKNVLVFVDTGRPLTDAQIAALNTRLALRTAGLDDDRPRLVSTATPGLQWDEASLHYIDTRQGVPIAKVPTTATVFEAMSGIPADYQPPTPPTPTPSFAQRTAVGEDYYRSPFDR